jgi:hypothetical protein
MCSSQLLVYAIIDLPHRTLQ